MARIRTTKPEFWGDEKLAPLTPIDRLVFLGLISMADDAGRVVDNVKSIDGFIFPETEDSSRQSLDTLAGAGRVLRYHSASGQRLIQVVNWSKHQKVDNPSKYTLPAPPTESEAAPALTKDAGCKKRRPIESVVTPSRSDLGPRTNDQRPTITTGASGDDAGDGDLGADREINPEAAEFDALWPAYPRRAGGNSKTAAFRAWRARVHAKVPREEMTSGVARYAAFIRATGKEGSEYVMLGATFFGQNEHWREPWTLPVAGVKGSIGVAPETMARALALWERYKSARLLSRLPRDEYERIGHELVAAGTYSSLTAFLDELRITQPWTLDAKTDGYAINELSRRLAVPQKVAS